ncbi:hypothetical protein D1872_241090 [compost metagenome]
MPYTGYHSRYITSIKASYKFTPARYWLSNTGISNRFIHTKSFSHYRIVYKVSFVFWSDVPGTTGLKKNGSQRFIIRVDRSHVFACFFFNYFTDFNVLIPSDILKIFSLITSFFQIIGAVEHTCYTDIKWYAVHFFVNRKRIHFVLRKLFEIHFIRKVCKCIRISGYIFLNVRVIDQNDVRKTFLNACRQVGIQFLFQISLSHIYYL